MVGVVGVVLVFVVVVVIGTVFTGIVFTVIASSLSSFEALRVICVLLFFVFVSLPVGVGVLTVLRTKVIF